jgi:hypothetical protein
MARPKLEDQQKNLSEARKLYTRTQIAKLLGIGSRNTLRAYEWLAFFCVKDYLSLMRDESGSVKRGKPLTHYQVWVLAKIQKMHNAVPNGCEARDEVYRFLKENPHLASAESYMNEMASLIRSSA